MDRSGEEISPNLQHPLRPSFFSFLFLHSWLSFSFPSRLLGSSSHKGRLVWVFLTGQIEVSLLPSESDSLPPLTVPDFKCMATPPLVSR